MAMVSRSTLCAPGQPRLHSELLSQANKHFLKVTKAVFWVEIVLCAESRQDLHAHMSRSNRRAVASTQLRPQDGNTGALHAHTRAQGGSWGRWKEKT